jgi:hypothetical protein
MIYAMNGFGDVKVRINRGLYPILIAHKLAKDGDRKSDEYRKQTINRD